MDKLNILLVTGVVTAEHDYRRTNELLRTMLEATGRFDVRITEDFNGASAQMLNRYDAVFINYDGRLAPTDKAYARWDAAAERAFFDFVQSGGGAVVYHSSVWLDEALPDDYKRLWGLYLTTPAGGRRNPKDEMVMKIDTKAGPITAGLPEESCILNDDLFAGFAKHPAADVRVLATVFDNLENYRVPYFPPPHHPVVIPGGKLENMVDVNTDMPVCWTNTFGEGRLFALTLGHELETLRRVPYITLLCRGAEWAASGNVTLGPPDRSGENRFKPWPYY